METKLQPIEIQPARCSNHDLAVEDAAVGHACQQYVVKLGKVPVERLQITALNVDIRVTAKNDRPKAVPFWFVQEVADRELRRELGEHRFDGWLEKTGHSGMDPGIWSAT